LEVLRKTYQWNGLEDLDKLKNDRTFNVSVFIQTNLGTLCYYDNETDNYQQDHYNCIGMKS
jgi:iron complex outermembrane receptor protein